MGIKFRAVGGLLVLLAASISIPAFADDKRTTNYETANEIFDRAYFKNDRNFYGNNTFRRQIDWLVGSGSLFRNSFPENEIARDAELVNVVYRDVLNQQVGNDPYIRTPDLPNPYNTSLMMSPRLNSNKLKTGTEFRFDTVPPR
ncbi:hypothetical protein H6G81_32670 [Scytonema hofmannii FACHB-248]|uniref:Uncharacterized protein n=1 Tax=Scytonema hofmannii FACHB-248 TaxID=1842502 RepID=A0ABR8H115_9CYAN|nr:MULTISPECIES: hypothetical protein [Nostocales]MBD2609144.1 hypothetical protein [Scytonema hofmannii FACHB-248]